MDNPNNISSSGEPQSNGWESLTKEANTVETQKTPEQILAEEHERDKKSIGSNQFSRIS